MQWNTLLVVGSSALCTGVACGLVWQQPTRRLAVLTILAALATWRAKGRRQLVLLGLFFFLLGWWRVAFDQRAMEDVSMAAAEAPQVTCQGYVVSLAHGDRPSSFYLRVTAAPSGFEGLCGMLLRCWVPPWLALELRRGQALSVSGRLSPPPSAGSPGQFDYARYLRSRGVAALLTVQRCSPCSGSDPWGRTLLIKVAGWCEERLQQPFRSLDGVGNVLLPAMVLGERAALEESHRQVFAAAGAGHLLAVSGLHVGFVTLAIWGALKVIGVPRLGRIFVLAASLGLYVIICDSRPSVVRACIMSVGALLRAEYRLQVSWPALWWGAAAVLVWPLPFVLTDVGFQMSFLATIGLLTGIRTRAGGPRGWLLRAVSASLGAQLATFPLGLYHFFGLSPYALVANLVSIPLAGLVVVSALAGSVLSALELLPVGWAMAPARIGSEALWGWLSVISKLPYSVLWLGRPPMASLFAYYLIWTAGILLPRWRARLLLVGLLSMVLLWWAQPEGTAAELVIVDVGQGDCIFIRSPEGHIILVDTGPGGDEAPGWSERAVESFLRARGIRRIDAIVLTHPHLDHTGGMEYLRQRFPTGTIYRATPATYGLDVPSRGLMRGEVLVFGTLRLKVLHPGPRVPESQDPVNDMSLVLEVGAPGLSALLMGDAGIPAEVQMLEEGLLRPVQLLKVGHHGSNNATSRGLLEACRPVVAVISVGPNSAGHPSSRVLQELKRFGAVVLRTDVDGAVSVSGGAQTALWTFRTRRQVVVVPLAKSGPSAATRAGGDDAQHLGPRD